MDELTIVYLMTVGVMMIVRDAVFGTKGISFFHSEPGRNYSDWKNESISKMNEKS